MAVWSSRGANQTVHLPVQVEMLCMPCNRWSTQHRLGSTSWVVCIASGSALQSGAKHPASSVPVRSWAPRQATLCFRMISLPS